MLKTSHLRRFKRFGAVMLVAGAFSLICPVSGYCGADLWTSLSVRDSYYGEKLDFEIKVGGSGYNTSWMWGFERENDEYFKMSDAQYMYEGFKWQWFRKEAVNIDFSEALWWTHIGFFKYGRLVSGGSLRNDMAINKTVYLAYLGYTWGALKIDYLYNGIDYHSLDLNYKKNISKEVYLMILYKDVNGNKFRQAKITYEFHFTKGGKK